MTDDQTSVSVRTTVQLPPAQAFRLFTEGIGSWWDKDKHILEAPLEQMIFEPFVGGHIIDRGTDGSECRWARVLAYDFPDRVVFSWDINVQWQIETDPAKASEVEIAFTQVSPGSTEVVLTHRHLDRHGQGWTGMRDAVAGGWNLDGFAAAARQPFSGMALTDPLPSVTDQDLHAWLASSREYSVMVLRRTETYARPQFDAVVFEHARRNLALQKAGYLPVVLPCLDDSEVAGFGVFAADAATSRRLMADDPGVRAGIFAVDVHPVRGAELT